MKTDKNIFSGFLLLMFIFITAGLLSISGCVKKNRMGPVENPDSVADAAELRPDYMEVGRSFLPSITGEAVESLRVNRGYLICRSSRIDDNKVVVLIFLGEKMTGGYGISIEAFEENNSELVILIREIKPGPDSMVTQAITYPYIAIELEDTHKTYSVKTIDNESFIHLQGSEPQ